MSSIKKLGGKHMTKLHIAVYSCKALSTDDLFDELTQYAQKVNRQYKNERLIYYHPEWADFDKFLETQYFHYKKVRYYQMYDLTKSGICKIIYLLSILTLYTAQKDIEILNFKVWKRKNGMLRLTAYIPYYDV